MAGRDTRVAPRVLRPIHRSLSAVPIGASTLRDGSIFDHGGRIAPPTPGALCSRSQVACQEGRQNFIALRQKPFYCAAAEALSPCFYRDETRSCLTAPSPT